MRILNKNLSMPVSSLDMNYSMATTRTITPGRLKLCIFFVGVSVGRDTLSSLMGKYDIWYTEGKRKIKKGKFMHGKWEVQFFFVPVNYRKEKERTESRNHMGRSSSFCSGRWISRLGLPSQVPQFGLMNRNHLR